MKRICPICFTELPEEAKKMFINLTKTEVEETITALEDIQTYLEENGMEDCTRCNLEIVKSVKGRLMKELLIQVM